MSKKQPVALIVDADVYAYQAASAVEVVHNWDGIYVNEANIDNAVQIVKTRIEELKRQLKADKVIMCFSCATKRYWRHEVMPTYKMNRKGPRGPICLSDLKKTLGEHFESECWVNMEGDDVMGILATWDNYLDGYKKIVVSIDKDMQTLPDTWLYNPDKDYQPWFNTANAADRYFLTQAIGGDSTDGYPGAIGMSTQSAATFLNDPWLWERYEHTFKSGPRKGESEWKWRKAEPSFDLWENIVSLFLKAGQTEDDALANARVARICRADDYDFETSNVILWRPE